MRRRAIKIQGEAANRGEVLYQKAARDSGLDGFFGLQTATGGVTIVSAKGVRGW